MTARDYEAEKMAARAERIKMFGASIWVVVQSYGDGSMPAHDVPLCAFHNRALADRFLELSRDNSSVSHELVEVPLWH